MKIHLNPEQVRLLEEKGLTQADLEKEDMAYAIITIAGSDWVLPHSQGLEVFKILGNGERINHSYSYNESNQRIRSIKTEEISLKSLSSGAYAEAKMLQLIDPKDIY